MRGMTREDIDDRMRWVDMINTGLYLSPQIEDVGLRQKISQIEKTAPDSVLP